MTSKCSMYPPTAIVCFALWKTSCGLTPNSAKLPNLSENVPCGIVFNNFVTREPYFPKQHVFLMHITTVIYILLQVSTYEPYTEERGSF